MNKTSLVRNKSKRPVSTVCGAEHLCGLGITLCFAVNRYTAICDPPPVYHPLPNMGDDVEIGFPYRVVQS